MLEQNNNLQALLEEEKNLKKTLQNLKEEINNHAEISDLIKLKKDLESDINSLKSEKQKNDEIVKGIIDILKSGDNPQVRSILSELTTVRIKLHGSLNLVAPMLLSFLITSSVFIYLGVQKYINEGAAIFLGLFSFIFLAFPISYIWDFWLKRKERRLLEQIGKFRSTEELKDIADPDAFFRQLVQINFTHIDGYYRQTQIQANKSFWVSLICALAAFGIIIYGIYLINTSNKQFAYVTTVSGILSEFIAAVFFYLYNQTIRSMGIYHQKLVLTQNVSLAIKVAQDLKDNDKAKAQDFIIQQLLKDINQQLVFNEK